MKDGPVFIWKATLLSSAGLGWEEHRQALTTGQTTLKADGEGWVCGRIPLSLEERLQHKAKLWKKREDRTVLLSSLVKDHLFPQGSAIPPCPTVLMTSSRGAVYALEEDWSAHAKGGRIHPLSSPRTTLGRLPSALFQDLGVEKGGLSLALSAACAGGLHCVGLATLLIQGGLSDHVLAGGSEAPLTGFSRKQLESLGVLSTSPLGTSPPLPFPTMPMSPHSRGMILGEGAALLHLGREDGGLPGEEPLGQVLGYGAATEQASMTGLSAEGQNLQWAIAQALARSGIGPEDVDGIIGHGSGTPMGDQAELQAYRKVFQEDPPPMYWLKWLNGHMLGVSPLASIVMALDLLHSQSLPDMPYALLKEAIGRRRLRPLKYILVTAMGFGGGAGALVLSRV